MLALSGLMLGSARADEPKRYSVSLAESRISGIDIAPGEYKVLIHRDEAKAEVMDTRTRAVIDGLTPKVEEAESKFNRTEVVFQIVDGVRQINEIRIGGTKIKVNFRQGS
jgi:hypothetical protein